MTSSPVSIVVPVFNVEDYLPRCHESLLAQSYDNYEIIYVDDGSTDASGVICDCCANATSNVKVIHKSNEGLGFARNTGMRIAKGRYVVFVDPDDYIAPDLVSKLVLPISNRGIEFSLAGFSRVSGGSIVPQRLPDVGEPFVGNRAVLAGVFCRMLGNYPGRNDYIEMSSCARLYDLNLIKSKQIWFNSERECLSEDLDFNSRYLAHVHSALCTDSVGYYYCDNQNSLTTTYRSDRFEKQTKLYRQMLGLADSLDLGAEARIRLDDTLTGIARYSIKMEVAERSACDSEERMRAIGRICDDELLRSALLNLKSYPVPLKNRLVNTLIFHRQIMLLILVMAAKNKFGV